MSARFAGRRVVVTGASRGIGAATARRFAAEGAKVALVARTVEQHEHLSGSLHETADRINAAGGRAVIIASDLTDADDRARIVPEAVAQLDGPIDILINNAAAAMYAPVGDFPLKRRRVIFEVNVHAPLDLTQAVLPAMIEQGAGWIVNLSSATARPVGNPTMAVYGASKAALNRWTLGLASELEGTGVHVNTVEPRAAVMSEGAEALIGSTVRADQIETMEQMVEAVVALGDCEFTGRLCVSLDLIAELGLTVHDLDGTSPHRPD
ncbi:MAG TPA: SDR family NAD(P)-dependent oxidoreductase [Acidimicrobiia bacterium]|nr:SDR family NAD(P)-dependent oxidoreductase [Acidimicrobiia bacterium]